MQEAKVIAGNGTVVEADAIYLTYSGDEHEPYKFAKVISVGADIWLKLFDANSTTSSQTYEGEFHILAVSVEMFLAWSTQVSDTYWCRGRY